uniref:Uncharacterized protein n=1 Tax=Candidatus Kentrum sp. LPFa TaxID=2126335 RepID=A0A450WXH9_9GAMM|nr:MAG: hypothetical protein BECKLPF1236B_GA0070989_12716 [Candidatus Kentron sp. LPFa]
MTYTFHPAAESEHLKTVAYYESQRKGLGADYLTEFESAMGGICEAMFVNAWPIPGCQEAGYTARENEKIPIHHFVSGNIRRYSDIGGRASQTPPEILDWETAVMIPAADSSGSL